MLKTKQGIFSLGGRNDFIAKSLMNHGEFELDLMTASTKLLRELDLIPAKGEGTFLDIGAHIGVISIGMLVNGEFENAIAVEPEKKNFELLEKNVEQNGLADRFTCIHSVVSNHNGSETRIELNKLNSGDNRVRVGGGILGWEIQTVSSTTIETIIDEVSDVDLIWIDVQGHEWHAFDGAKSYLKNIPVVSEIWAEGLRFMGVSKQKFIDMVSSIWPHYWDLEGGKFVKYSTVAFKFNNGLKNVVFTP